MSASRWAARPRNWAITAAAVATLVCAVAWPRLTGYAVGTMAATAALWFGIRGLIREHRTPPSPGHCEIVHLDAGPARITSDRPLTDTELRHAQAVIAAARRRYAAEHPDEESSR